LVLFTSVFFSCKPTFAFFVSSESRSSFLVLLSYRLTYLNLFFYCFHPETLVCE
jgi:hypothetical protein